MARSFFTYLGTSDSAKTTSDTSKVELNTRSTHLYATDADIISTLGGTRQPANSSRASPLCRNLWDSRVRARFATSCRLICRYSTDTHEPCHWRWQPRRAASLSSRSCWPPGGQRTRMACAAAGVGGPCHFSTRYPFDTGFSRRHGHESRGCRRPIAAVSRCAQREREGPPIKSRCARDERTRNMPKKGSACHPLSKRMCRTARTRALWVKVSMQCLLYIMLDP